MKTIACLLLSLVSNDVFSQEESPSKSIEKHLNSFGVSFEFGGGLEKANDIMTLVSNPSVHLVVEPVGKPNIGAGLFWEHQWNFHREHGLLFGIGATYTSFYNGIRFRNPQVVMGEQVANTKEYILGDFRHSFASLDLPLCYTTILKTKIGTFNPFGGVTLKTIAYVEDAGRNYGGVSSVTSEINGNDTIYYNHYSFRYGTTSISPVLMPTIGLKYSTGLKNGGKINVYLSYKLFLRSFSTVETYLNDYDNVENGITYQYFNPNSPMTYNQSTGELSYAKQSVYFRVNLSSINVGVSYTLK